VRGTMRNYPTLRQKRAKGWGTRPVRETRNLKLETSVLSCGQGHSACTLGWYLRQFL
jgi:hypothetical protein